MNANRRLQERRQPERRVFCKLGGEENSLVLDLSEDGLRFESLMPIEKKDLLQLRLSVNLNDAIEATGKLAWIDSAKRTGGLRFLDLSAPAREQIRAWLSETAAASNENNQLSSPRKRDKQAADEAAAEKPATLEKPRVPNPQLLSLERQREEICVPSTQLVPIERYRKQTRAQFLRGVLVGFGVCAVLMIPIIRYSGGRNASGTKSWAPEATTASATRAPQSGGEQTRASVAQPVSSNASISEPTAMKPRASGSEAVQTVFAAAPTVPRQKQNLQGSPQFAGASSTNPVTRISSPAARPPAAKVEPPLGTSPAIATAPAASKSHSSLGQAQNPKKVSATAQQLWSELQAGDINAAVALADLYARGEGVPVNCQQARVLLLAASAKNNAEASRKLQALNNGGCPASKE